VAAGSGAVFAAGAFLDAALVTPFLMELIIVFFAAGAVADAFAVPAAATLAPVLRTTVAVLPSLDSLTPLALRVVRVAEAALGGGAVAATPRRVRVAVVPAADELVVDDVVALRVAAARVDLAFSTMFPSTLAAAACFMGDTGRAMSDFAGEAGRSRFSLEFDEVGDSTFDGSGPASWTAAWPRSLFFGLSIFASWFSLSAAVGPSLNNRRPGQCMAIHSSLSPCLT
jgi:hypothetical protein